LDRAAIWKKPPGRVNHPLLGGFANLCLPRVGYRAARFL
jgi:hypothetical protein